MIWGVDLGVRSAHLFCVDQPQTVSVVIPKMTKRGLELRALRHQLSEFITREDVVFVEEPPLAGSRNVRTFAALNQVYAIVLSSTSEAYSVEVGTWKKQVVGKGNATKEEVSTWLEVDHSAYSALCGDDQNLRDAACIALYGRAVLDRLPHGDGR